MAVGVRPLVTVCEEDTVCDSFEVCDLVCVGLLVADIVGVASWDADPVEVPVRDWLDVVDMVRDEVLPCVLVDVSDGELD